MNDSESFEREMIVREADWTWSEMQDFNRLLQRYRYTYIAALFGTVGWILGQMFSKNSTPITDMALRPDVAGILSIVPMINAVFVLLMMEAARKVQALARYRFVLSVKLGRTEPVWRWELFRRPDEEGNIRQWETPANVFFGLLGLMVSVICYWSAWLGARSSNGLRYLWLASLGFFLAVVVSVIRAGWIRRRENDVADPVERAYDALQIQRKR